MPWQRHVVDVALEHDPATGELVYEEIILTVPRQAGKSTLIFAWLVWRMTVAAKRWGPQNGTYLAQTRTAARKKLERDFARRLRTSKRSFCEIRNPRARPARPMEWKISLNNGAENILFGTDSYLQIEAPSETASHGDTLDMPVIDEAFAQRDDAVEQAVEPTMMTRFSPQLVVVSTAGNEKSSYLFRKVVAGRRACERGRHGRVCYLEWSAPDDLDFDAPGAFESYHPAVGYTITVERLRAKLDKARRLPDASAEEDGDDPGEDGFRRAYGNQWVREPLLGDQERPKVIDEATWSSWADPASRIDGRLVFGVAVSPGGTSAAIVVAGYRADGLTHIELVQQEAGIWWAEKRLLELVAKWRPDGIGYDAGGPTRAIAPEIERAAGTVPVTKIDGRDYAAACQAFLSSGRVRHTGLQQDLTHAARGAEARAVGGGWIWSWDSPVQIVSLVAATVAARTLERLPAPAPAVAEPFFMFS